ncbi:MAG: DUF1631 family protein [Burkholderiales bacterium]|nr:DUF1631 family protein [Burkholderiales bacterium]
MFTCIVKHMEPNELLSSTRAEFMHAFQDAVRKIVPHAVEALYFKADASFSSIEQRLFLNARTILQEKREDLFRQMSSEMEHLLNRSFQTTYSKARPSAALTHDAEELTLLDSSAFENALRINDITQRFRDEAEHQLRDLNIRIALLFGQDNIKERENPFRPYLFSRCIANTIESFQLLPELNTILLEQIGENLAGSVDYIYQVANAQLAKHGIAAQLPLKINKAPDKLSRRSGSDAADEDSSVDDGADVARSGTAARRRARGASAEAGAENIAESRIEQLFESVRGMASGSPMPHVENAPLVASQSAENFSWLSGTQAVGGVLRKFFGKTESYHAADLQSGMPGGLLAPAASIVTTAMPAVSAAGGAAGPGYGGDGGPAFSGAAAGAAGVRSAGVAPYPGPVYVPGADTRLTCAVKQMQQQGTPDTAAIMDERGEVRNLIQEHRDTLNSMAQSADEQMTIDIVAMLFEFILRDNQVPAEVRAQLGRLQFLVLKIALRDNSVLTHKGHPARLLVNRIGSISLGLKQLDPSGTYITAEICHIVETLLCDDSENPELFPKMLDQFDAFIAKQLRTGDQNVERTVAAVEQVQNHTLRYAHTEAQMAEALSRLTIDPYLEEFLETAWVQVIALAERSDVKLSQRYRLMVPDLLWSIVPKVGEDDRSQLFALLPILLNTLREGLSSIRYDSQQQQALLNWLVDAHTSALRAGNTQSPPPSLPAIHEHFNNFVNNFDAAVEVDLKSGKLPDTRKFLQEAIRDLDLQVRVLDAEVDQELPQEEEPASAEAALSAVDVSSILERLRSGVALEISLSGRPSNGCLTWVNPNLSNLILSMDGQAYPSILSVRVFRRMLECGRVRFIESEPLFERAIQSLLKSADEMDAVAA